jgi:predicted ATPase
VLVERQRLEDQYLGALQKLVVALEQAGDLDQALEYARRAVIADPLREEAHYELMRLYAAAGQPSACLHQYQELERLLREELGESPSAATRALAEELRDSARTVVVARSAPPAPAASSSAPSPSPQHAVPPVLPPAPQVIIPSAPRLPAQFTRFFGREEEIAHVVAMLRVSETRLVTITGPGGSGKTRLAVAVAGRLQAEFEDALWFVPLAEVADSRRTGEAIRDAMGLPSTAGGEAIEQVTVALSQQRSLLLLDNFEQLVETGAPLVKRLLERAPSLTCLVTSRQRLALEGELEFAALPLPTPRASDFGFRAGARSAGPVPGSGRLDFGLPAKASDPPKRPPLTSSEPIQNPDVLLSYPSVQLFVDRAQAARPEFRLTEANAAAVAALCDRLEGLPLALELAASRADVLTPEQMLSRLRGRAEPFQFLVSHRRDVSARHQTLRAAMEWSYQLLSPDQQRFFRCLSVFRGGWSLEAAEAICGSEGPSDTPSCIDFLAHLREASLVAADEVTSESGMRYRLLETVRAFAAEQMASDEQEHLARRHFDYFLFFIQGSWDHRRPEHAKLWLRRVDVDYENIRTALEWALAADPRAALEMVDKLENYWYVRGLSAEALIYLPRAAQWQSEDTIPKRSAALRYAGVIAAECGELDRARPFLEEALALMRRLGQPAWSAAALNSLANVDLEQGHYERARALFQESIAVLGEDAPDEHRSSPLSGLGDAARALGDYERARACYEESLAIYRRGNDERHSAQRLSDLGILACCEGDPVMAEPLFQQSLATFQEYGDKAGIGTALQGLGDVALLREEHATAGRYYRESLTIFREIGRRQHIAAVLERLARLAAAEADPTVSVRLLAAAQALRDTLGTPRPPSEQPGHETQAESLLQAMGEAAFTAEWDAGRALSWVRAAALALGEE